MTLVEMEILPFTFLYSFFWYILMNCRNMVVTLQSLLIYSGNPMDWLKFWVCTLKKKLNYYFLY